MQFELTRYLSDNWVPILEKDVDGPISVPLRFVVAWSIPGIIQGPLVLWLTRLLAAAIYPASKAPPQPTFR